MFWNILDIQIPFSKMIAKQRADMQRQANRESVVDLLPGYIDASYATVIKFINMQLAGN